MAGCGVSHRGAGTLGSEVENSELRARLGELSGEASIDDVRRPWPTAADGVDAAQTQREFEVNIVNRTHDASCDDRPAGESPVGLASCSYYVRSGRPALNDTSMKGH